MSFNVKLNVVITHLAHILMVCIKKENGLLLFYLTVIAEFYFEI